MSKGNWDTHQGSSLVKIMVAGDSGAGKSTQLGLLANAGYRVVIADFANGLDSLNNVLTEEGGQNVFFKTFRDDIAANKATAWSEYKKEVTGGEWEGAGKLSDFGAETVFAIDDMSGVFDAVKHYAMRGNGKKLTDRPSLPEFGTINDEIGAYVMDLLSSNHVGCHIVINTHWQLVDDEMGASRYYPKIGTKANSATNSGRYFNNLVWLKSDRKGKVLRTGGDVSKDLKVSRSNKVQQEMEADLAKLFQLLT